MNKWIYKIVLALSVWAVASCSDDERVPDITPPSDVDAYYGEYNLVKLKESMSSFRYADFVCEIRTESGDLIRREGSHVRINGQSELRFTVGLCSGTYRLLRLLAPEVGSISNDTTWVEYGLGCRIQIGTNVDSTMVMEEYDKSIGLYGKGTKSNPYIVSCSDHFRAIRDFTNDMTTNKELLDSTYFDQQADIDMGFASFKAGGDMGWLPIGNLTNCPFRGIYNGNNYAISNLNIDRSTDRTNTSIGLFGFAENALFKNVVMKSAKIHGHMGVGSLLGCAVAVGDERASVAVVDCTVENSTISAGQDGFAVGGLVGMVDESTDVMINNCTNINTNVSGDYCVGGLLGGGGRYSRSVLKKCTNNGSISANFTGAGGIVGSVDSLLIASCTNSGTVNGAVKYNNSADDGCLGAGGIAGGSGSAIVVACGNTASVKGHTGVGGIIGSTRICRDEREGLIFNDISAQSCYNKGDISGYTSVGGIVGEAQFGCYSVYNTGQVEATYEKAHVGGIAGNTSIAVLYDALNAGTVLGNKVGCAGGVIGKTVWGNLYVCQNVGEVNVDARYAGGIIGLAGNYTVANYCGNYGQVSNTASNSLTGGVIGEIGDPKSWSPEDIALCVIGAAEVVLGVASPIISFSGEALQGTEYAYLSGFIYVMHIGEKALDGLTFAYDVIYGLGFGIAKMFTAEELGVPEAEMKAEFDKNHKELKDEMKNRLSKVDFNNILASNLNVACLHNYIDNLNKVCESYEKEDNAKAVNYNMNNAREKRYKTLSHGEKIKKITHLAVSGAAVILCTVAFFVGVAATDGLISPVAPMIIGFIGTYLGGVNAITESCLNFKQNVVVVSQCVNIGTIKASQAQYVGGVIGNAHQNCYINDCLNAGNYIGKISASGGLVGHASADCDVTNCLNVGSDWASPIVGEEHSANLLNNYYYDKQLNSSTEGGYDVRAEGLSLKDLCNPSRYYKWNMKDSTSIWAVTPKEGYFPIPMNSEMQKPKKE